MKKIQVLRNKKGFTLVELIVVIVIIAILSAALVTSLVGYINKAKDTNALLEANNVYIAAQAYVSEKYAAEASGTNAPNSAMYDAINEYLGETVVGAGAGTITVLHTGSVGTIDQFTYVASNGSTVVYSGSEWEVNPNNGTVVPPLTP